MQSILCSSIIEYYPSANTLFHLELNLLGGKEPSVKLLYLIILDNIFMIIIYIVIFSIYRVLNKVFILVSSCLFVSDFLGLL